MNRRGFLTDEEFADQATDVLFESLSRLPPEEQDRRIDAFEGAVRRTIESKRSAGAAWLSRGVTGYVLWCNVHQELHHWTSWGASCD